MTTPDIFLSYNREDAAVAKRFADAFGGGEGTEKAQRSDGLGGCDDCTDFIQ